MTWTWEGQRIVTYQDLIAAVVGCKNPAKAHEFLRAYSSVVGPEAARHNIGYIIGEVDREVGRRIMLYFDVEHPVFGTKYPTAEEAFQAGIRAAQEMMKKANDPPNPWGVGALQ